MKRVISFCLWGGQPIYTQGAIANAGLALCLFPGWTCRYYIADGAVPAECLAALAVQPNTELILRAQPGDPAAMLWRFEPADDPEVEVMISRDTDSRLSIREKRAVEAWLASDKTFHVMRDHPQHGVPMPGGLWGMKGRFAPGMKAAIAAFLAGFDGPARKGMDQNFLASQVWPLARRSVLEHDPFFALNPFPERPRDPGGVYFVGEVFHADGRFASQADRDELNRLTLRRCVKRLLPWFFRKTF